MECNYYNYSSLEAVNLPVTFHKKIKSSGYGTKPEALKYSKSKKIQKLKKMFVTRDFYSLPLPLTIPEETKFLCKTPMHTKPITRIKYSNQGLLLASASNDMTISILKWPAFEASKAKRLSAIWVILEIHSQNLS